MPPINSITTSEAPGTGTNIAPPRDVNKQQFLTLLVNQLKAQDPFEPVKNEAFLAQLATFSQLEEQQSTTQLIGRLVDLQRAQLALGGLSQGAGLIGKTVEYIDPETEETLSGVVRSVRFESSGVMLDVDGRSIPAGNVIGIGLGEATPTPPAGGGTSTGNGGTTPGNGTSVPLQTAIGPSFAINGLGA